MNKVIKVVDLFCGGGGLSKGLIDAGFNVVGAFDNWVPALSFYNKNSHSHKASKVDISDRTLIKSLIEPLHADMITGGPPCQDFSSAGKRSEGKRADLTVSYAELISEIRPQYFLMENVERARHSAAFASAIAIFKNAGYGISEAVLNAAFCGVPQIRKRLFVFGELDGHNNALTEIFKQKQSYKPMTLRDYFGSSLDVDHYYRHPCSYARRGVFSIDEPSPTIRGVNRPIPKGYHGHSGDSAPLTKQLRPLTTKERSMVQTFPKEWTLVGCKTDMEQIIGNAVPCNLAKFVGKSILAHLNNHLSHDYCVESSYQLTLFEQKAKYTTG